jgi:hypothetical protein
MFPFDDKILFNGIIGNFHLNIQNVDVESKYTNRFLNDFFLSSSLWESK